MASNTHPTGQTGTLSDATYYADDIIGTPLLATTSNQSLKSQSVYYPYGNLYSQSPANSETNPSIGFAGKVHEANTGLSYSGARYYDPTLGRFISTDPVGFKSTNPMTFNRYDYADNNPYRYVDPTGDSFVNSWFMKDVGEFNNSVGYYRNDIEFGLGFIATGGTDTIPMAIAAFGPKIAEVGEDVAVDFGAEEGSIGANVPKGTAEKIFQAQRVGSGLKDDAAHRAASFLSKEQLQAGKTFPLRGGDGVELTLLQTEGDLNDNKGIYEYILDPAGKVTHQRFIEDGVINGIPNQSVPKVP